MLNEKHIVDKIYKGSIAEELEIEPGDELVSINGKKINDIIDYLYLISDDYIEIEIIKNTGEQWVLEIEKDYDEDLGVEFKSSILDKAQSCKNKCIFCFIDQLPKNMRESLYFKDDDSRLSFLQGNFLTLTNLSDEDIQRIIDYNISPINISVHTTNPDLRVKMLMNKNAGNILERIKKLTENRIKVNGQIVLCPNINDGDYLDETIQDLYPLYPNFQSLAIVPVGITKYREGLYPLSIYDKRNSKLVIDKINKWQAYLKKKIGTNFVYLSDEFYIMADESFPSYDSYEKFLQLENGVGLVKKLENEFVNYLNELNDNISINKTISIATGMLAKPFIANLIQKLTTKVKGLNVNIFEIKNNFFGETITVSGLITGKDIIEQLYNEDLGQALLIPNSMLKANENIFLDDITIEDIEKELNIKVLPCEVNGKTLIDKILY